jgi:uncharacterized metal-binding protein YceD (DUF177 family)
LTGQRAVPDTVPDLSRPFAIDRMGEAARLVVEASETERAAVARRLGIVQVGSLVCRFALRRWEGATVQALGTLTASVTQICVVSMEPFDSAVSEEFEVRFVPEGSEAEEIDLEAPDEIPYAGGSIDLGEAAVEQLALALDPFPRKPGAVVPEAAQDAVEHPFDVLKGRQ